MERVEKCDDSIMKLSQALAGIVKGVGTNNEVDTKLGAPIGSSIIVVDGGSIP